jgi:hypothetical protein
MKKGLKYTLITLGIGALSLGAAYLKYDLSRKLEDKLQDRRSTIQHYKSTSNKLAYTSKTEKRIDALENCMREAKFTQDFIDAYRFFINEGDDEIIIKSIMQNCEIVLGNIDKNKLEELKKNMEKQEFNKFQYIIDMYREAAEAKKHEKEANPKTL